MNPNGGAYLRDREAVVSTFLVSVNFSLRGMLNLYSGITIIIRMFVFQLCFPVYFPTSRSSADALVDSFYHMRAFGVLAMEVLPKKPYSSSLMKPVQRDTSTFKGDPMWAMRSFLNQIGILLLKNQRSNYYILFGNEIHIHSA